jgi:integrase
VSDDAGVKQVAKNQWSVRVKRIDMATGQQANRRATVFGSKADALKKRDEIRAELATMRRGRVRLVEYSTAWLARRAPTLKPGTVRKYYTALTHIVPVLGELLVDAITPADVERYVAARARAAAGNTVLNELRLLRTIARDTVADCHAQKYWCERVKAPKVRGYTLDNPNLLTADQVALVLTHVPEQWLGLVLLLITTGLRIGEATALRWEQVRESVATISCTNYKGTEVDPKTRGSNRTVPVLPEVLARLGMRQRTGLVFPSRRGGLHRGSPLRSVLTKACAAAGVPRVTTHGLRRTFNNEARRRGAREVLKSITGHTTDAMVEKYSLVGEAEKAELSRAVAGAVGVPAVSASARKDGGK